MTYNAHKNHKRHCGHIGRNVLLGILLIPVLLNPKQVYAANKCAPIEVVFARGSGESLSAKESNRFKDQIDSKIHLPLTYNFYELGSEAQDKHKYPAVDVGNPLNGNAIGAWLSRGSANDYGDSVKEGVKELNSYLAQRVTQCAPTGSVFVLSGYSQGAQVIGQYLQKAPDTVKQKIAFVSFFGDPKLYLPEGRGIIPPACYGRNLSPYRRAIGNCMTDNGSLGARNPYLPEDMSEKTGLWCHDHDFICGSTKIYTDNDGHETYANDGDGIDQAVEESLLRVKSLSPTMEQLSISNLRSSAGLDVVFMVKSTNSMNATIDSNLKTFSAEAKKIIAMNGRVALVTYNRSSDGRHARILTDFTKDSLVFDTQLATLKNYMYNTESEPHVLADALSDTLGGVSWKSRSAKTIVIYTNPLLAYYPDNEMQEYLDGELQEVADHAAAIDPVNIYSVTSESADTHNAYTKLAELTSGQVLSYDQNNLDSFGASIEAVTTKLQQRPFALLKLPHYLAEVNQRITFDTSDSYVADTQISRYRWDFNGDSAYDEESTSPVVQHSYDSPFDGLMQVQLVAANGTIASASATVTVVPPITSTPELPTPHHLAIVQDNKSDVTISWQSSDPTVHQWLISSDGIQLGLLPAQAAHVTIGDLRRNEQISIEITAVDANNVIGGTAAIIIPAIIPQSIAASRVLTSTHVNSKNTFASTILGDTTKKSSPLAPPTAEHPFNGAQSSAQKPTTTKNIVGRFAITLLGCGAIAVVLWRRSIRHHS